MTRKDSRRIRLLSESASTDHQHHNEPLKGILKNSRIPTKRSVSECIDDLSQFMDDLDINIEDLKSRRFCPLHPFPEQAEYDEHDDSCDEDDDEDDDVDGDDDDDNYDDDDYDDDHQEEQDRDGGKRNGILTTSKLNNNNNKEPDVIEGETTICNSIKSDKQDKSNKDYLKQQPDENQEGGDSKKLDKQEEEINNQERGLNINDDKKQIYSDYKRGCACYDRYRSDSSDGSNYSDSTTKPRKKSVHFDEHVYETVYIASRLYDRRAMAKYRFSTRHHPPANGNNKQNNKQSKKRTAVLSKSETKPTTSPITISTTKNNNKKQSEGTAIGCRQTKSQRAKQSKKDKRKMRSNRSKDESCSSDDQGYGSSILN